MSWVKTNLKSTKIFGVNEDTKATVGYPEQIYLRILQDYFQSIPSYFEPCHHYWIT